MIRKLFFAAIATLAAALAPSFADAQCTPPLPTTPQNNPGWCSGYTPTQNQWAAAFGYKLDWNALGLAVGLGGTGSTTASGARTSLGLAIGTNIQAYSLILTQIGNAGLVQPNFGGTGVNNGTNTLTLGGQTIFAGGYPVTFNFSGSTNVTFPTSGTLLSSATPGSFVSSFNTRTGAVTLNNADVTTALGFQPRIVGSPTFYVSTTGSNSNDCLAPAVGGGHGPCATIQYAASLAYSKIDGPSVVNIADGTYSVGDNAKLISLAGAVTGADQIQFVGDCGSPSSVVLSVGNNSTVADIEDYMATTFSCVKFQSTGTGSTGAYSRQNGTLDLFNDVFGDFSGGSQIIATENADVNISNPTITGSAVVFESATISSKISATGTATIPTALAYTVFAEATQNSNLIGNMTFSGPGVAGTTGIPRSLSYGAQDLTGNSWPGNVATNLAPPYLAGLSTSTDIGGIWVLGPNDALVGTAAGSGGEVYVSSSGTSVIGSWVAGNIQIDGVTCTLATPCTVSPAVLSGDSLQTYNLTTASGTQVITGIGFQPSACDAHGSVNGSALGVYTTFTGHSDSGLNQTVTYGNAGNIDTASGFIMIAIDVTGSNEQLGQITSYDSNGVTITWTKVGSPTGTFTFGLRCFK